jgi:hypothetical protein
MRVICNNFPNFTDFQPPAKAFLTLILGTKALQLFFARNNEGIRKKWPQVLAQGAVCDAHL